MWPFTPSYLTVVQQKRDQRAHALDSAPSTFTEEHQLFTKASATEIVSRIRGGEWTASQVLEAYIARAKMAHEHTNCLTEIMFDSARERAKALDIEFVSSGNVKGPLHGVPVSIKEQFEITGFDTSVGFTRWANNPAKINADIVDILLAAGAVPFVKTNIPQTMFAFECSNPLWGRTTNPYNDHYTSGGSSGGEAALLAMDGSPLGIGTDIGGSLRIPTAYCGIYSLKPGSQRVTYGGGKGPNPGFEGIKSVAGPMGRSVQDLELAARTIFGVQGRNHDIAPIPFRNITSRPMSKFGYYTSDGFVKASPACKRAVLDAVKALQQQGHECVEIEIPSAPKAFYIFAGLSSADGYRTMFSHIGPDPMEPAIRLVSITPKLPRLVRSLLAWIVEHALGDEYFAEGLRVVRPKSVQEYTQLVAERDNFTSNFYKEVWEKYGIDGIIAPVQPIPQLPHGGCNDFLPIGASTAYYNLIDLPVGTLPVTRVDAKIDQMTDEWWQGPGHGSKLLETGLFKGPKALYQPEQINGMPVGVQIIGRRWEDEKVLAMMKEVDEALGANRGFGPGAWDAFSKPAENQ
ncbi:amidase signature enzyme [Macrolepiota fuliginosa MF-IS2]|uniref:amidase n=1 Tax=Macrolepiota fuliginosa MF-IS2 TaxID=1400762 RepID=A0A9P5XN16_9AGAR|nr:amidase signature enzyme [Macrolepiota fuliginosa MF-IS2]